VERVLRQEQVANLRNRNKPNIEETKPSEGACPRIQGGKMGRTEGSDVGRKRERTSVLTADVAERSL